jgi:hypothetical protein
MFVETQCLRLTDFRPMLDVKTLQLFKILHQRRVEITSSFFLKKISNLEKYSMRMFVYPLSIFRIFA